MGIDYKLDTPIEGPKGAIEVLVVNRPTGRSFARHGVPFTRHFTTREDGSRTFSVAHNPAAMRGFLADMTGLDEITLDNLDGFDVMQLYEMVLEAVQNPQRRSD